MRRQHVPIYAVALAVLIVGLAAAGVPQRPAGQDDRPRRKSRQAVGMASTTGSHRYSFTRRDGKVRIDSREGLR